MCTICMAANDINPEVGTAMCRGFIQQIMEVTIGYRIFNVGDYRNKFKSLRADRVQMFINKTEEVPAGPFALTQ